MELLKFLQENDLEGFKENLDMDSIEEIDEEKNTILHHCVEKGAYDFVDALVYNGNFVKMQEEAKYNSYFFIADLHAD